MKAVIISCFTTYLERVELLREYYQKKGYETQVIMSDFDHIQKSKVVDYKNEYIYIPTKVYKKNLSVRRIVSHVQFSKKAFSRVDDIQPDLIHVLIPANSLVKEACNYKNKNPKIKLYVDIIDLWPETMPISKFKNSFLFKIWKNLRDCNLINADRVYTECDLYREKLGVIDNSLFRTLYWVKRTEQIECNPVLSDKEIHVCYLGSINNIIDIEEICRICVEISQFKRCIIHIIGKGEKKKEFIQKLENKRIEVIDHGVIYDNEEKQRIFDICHFGLNIMKKNVCVGLTMKSLDYFRAGLPIINNISSDTWKLVNKYYVGINVQEQFVEKLKDCDMFAMRFNVRELYLNMFTQDAFEKILDLEMRK